MKKCVIIYNPNSGKKIKKDFLATFIDVLLDNNYVPEVIFSRYKGHIIKIVEELDYVDLVISIGGDGTFNESVTGNFKRKNPLLLSHIPVGTTNDIGAMFGYGKDIIENLRMLLDGVEKNIDICTVNDRPFVYVAGFGKFMNVPYETSRNLKKKYGYVAYLLEGIKEFNNSTKLYDITYQIDNEVYNGLYSFGIMSNATRIAGINDFMKNVKLDDDKFEVLLCNITKKKDIVKSLYYLTTSDITKVPGFYFHKVNKMIIKFNSDDKRNWCIDGEKLEQETNTYEIKVKKGLRILLPKKNIEMLFSSDNNAKK
ncbi:MAG: YegS/Rv2252/BmrU family lipid kinase [bacterium]|nr:YegS/Rv2252/BmrU family lipid kinase [bacterium]